MIVVFLLLAFSFVSPLYAQPPLPEMVVRASPLPDQTIPFHPHTLSAHDLKTSQQHDIASALSSLPSVNITHHGFPGKMNRTEIRGSGFNNTVVLQDGILLNDTGSDGRPPLSKTLTHDLESAQVVIGPRALYYDPRAIGGVILLETKNPLSSEISTTLEAGAHRTFHEQAHLMYHSDQYGGYLGLSHLRTGTGTQKNIRRGNILSDDYHDHSATTRQTFFPHPQWEIDAVGYVGHSSTKIDAFSRPFPTASNDLEVNRRHRFKIGSTLTSFNERWQHNFHLSRQGNQNKTHSSRPFVSEGKTHQFSYEGIFYRSPQEPLKFGLTHIQEQSFLENYGNKSSRMTSAFVQTEAFLSPSLKLMGGARLIRHHLFSPYCSYWGGLDYEVFQDTTIVTSVGKGYRYPLIRELYPSHPLMMSNPNLQPEKSYAYDIGVKQKMFSQNTTLQLTYFWIQLQDLLQANRLLDGRWHMSNNKTRTSQGMEIVWQQVYTPTLSTKIHYTHTEAAEGPNKLMPLYLPKHMAGCNLTFSPTSSSSFFMSLLYKGAHGDQDFTRGLLLKQRESLEVRLGANYSLTPEATVFARIENVLNQKYEHNYGYGARGFSVYGGVTLKWS